MRLVLHAGLNKTGSTSIQTYLAGARAGLAQVGIIYPDLGGDNHWRVAAELISRSGRGLDPSGYLTERAARHGIDGTLDALAGVIREMRGEDGILVLSHENFGINARLEEFARFVWSVDPDVAITALAYCRDPASLYLSSVQHRIRVRGAFPEIENWVSPHIKRARSLGPPRVRIKLRCYPPDRLAGSDVVEDFREWLATETGRTPPAAPRSLIVNAALSAEACALILEIAGVSCDAHRDGARIREGIAAFDQGWRGRTKLKLPARMARALQLCNAQGWNDIVEAFDHTPEVRESLLIAPESSIPRIGPRAVERWLRSHASKTYRTEYLQSEQGRTATQARRVGAD